MVNQQLLDNIKQQLQQGISREQIKNSLMAKGWRAQDIDAAFSVMSSLDSQRQSSPPPAQTISSLPSASAIFGQAWTIYKQRLGTFLGVMAIPMLIMIAALAILSGAVFLGFNQIYHYGSEAGGIGLFALSGILGILVLVVIVISQAWGQTALLYAIKDSQEKIGIMESYRRGWHKIVSYWWVSLLVGLITIGGFLLLIVPGIIFAVWFSLAIFILIAEDLKGINALLKSREYVKGNWGGVFWRFFFITAVSLIISLVLVLIFSLLKIPFGSAISRFIIGLFLTPLAMTYSFLVYSNLKALKGDIAFAPTGGEKTAFIFVGILGILLIPTILFSALFLNLGSARKKARDAERQSDIRQIQAGLEMYYNEHNSYPHSLNELYPKYLPNPLVDPSTNQPYQYQLQMNGKDYQVCAQLESTKTQKCVNSQF